MIQLQYNYLEYQRVMRGQWWTLWGPWWWVWGSSCSPSADTPWTSATLPEWTAPAGSETQSEILSILYMIDHNDSNFGIIRNIQKSKCCKIFLTINSLFSKLHAASNEVTLAKYENYTCTSKILLKKFQYDSKFNSKLFWKIASSSCTCTMVYG